MSTRQWNIWLVPDWNAPSCVSRIRPVEDSGTMTTTLALLVVLGNGRCHPAAILAVIISSPPWTKWPQFRRRYFQMHFRERKVLSFD